MIGNNTSVNWVQQPAKKIVSNGRDKTYHMAFRGSGYTRLRRALIGHKATSKISNSTSGFRRFKTHMRWANNGTNNPRKTRNARTKTNAIGSTQPQLR